MYQLIRDFEEEGVVETNMAFVYRKTVDGSHLRRFFVAIITCVLARSEVFMQKYAETTWECPQFLMDANKALFQIIQGKINPPNSRHIANPCQCQQHDEGEGKCSYTRTSWTPRNYTCMNGDGGVYLTETGDFADGRQLWTSSRCGNTTEIVNDSKFHVNAEGQGTCT